MMNEEVVRLWHQQREILLGEHASEAESILWAWLGMLIGGKQWFEFFLQNISNGCGCGDDGGGISLPVDIVANARDNGTTDREFCVEVTLTEHGDGPDDVARMPMPMFLFHSSIAVVLHAKHVDAGIDPYAIIERIRTACSPATQFALVSEMDRQAVGLELEHWQQT